MNYVVAQSVALVLTFGCNSDLENRLSSSTSPLARGGCPAGKWDHDADQRTECAKHTECAEGTFIAFVGDSEVDRVCEPCASGTFSTEVNSPVCQPWRVCPSGTFVVSPGDRSSNPTCAACPSGTFSDREDAAACALWSDCQAGQFISMAGTVESDRMCGACPDGTSSTMPNAGACVGADECPQGTVQTSEGDCRSCAPGNYCPGGSSKQRACDEDSWDNDLDPASPCVPKTDCAVGQFVESKGDAISDRTCAPCADGEFSSTLNPASCTPWSDCSAPSSYMARAADATTDRVCGACAPPATTLADNQASCDTSADLASDDQIVIEAESYVSTSAGDPGAVWNALSDPASSGGVCMELTAPNESTKNWAQDIETTAPRLVYTINIETTGTFTVYLRGSAGDGGGHADSCWGGFDNVSSSQAFDFASDSGAWSWDAQTFSLSAGLHTFTLWPREDGVRVDKIVINNTGIAPLGLGPQASGI